MATRGEDWVGPSPRAPLRMMDLMVGVLAIGCASAVASRSWNIWSGFPATHIFVVGTFSGAIAAAVAVILGREALVRAAGGERKLDGAALWSIAWRVTAAIGMIPLVAETSYWLRKDPNPGPRPWWNDGGPLDGTVVARMGMLPILLCMVMIGVLAGSRPARSRPRPRSPALRLAKVPLVALVGVLMMQPASLVPYLVLIALDHVHLAMARPYAVLEVVQGAERIMQRVPSTPHVMLAARLARMGWETLAAGLMVIALAMLVVRDLEREDRETLPSWRGIGLRGLALMGAALAAVGLVGVSLPRLDPAFLEGLGVLLGPFDLGAIAFGFSGLAAGFAARSVARPADLERAPRPRMGRVWRAVAVLLVLAMASTEVVLRFPSVAESRWLGWYLPWRAGALEFLYKLTGYGPPSLVLTAQLVLWGGVFLWLVIAAGLQLIPRAAGPPAALDAVARSRARFGWYLWCWAALSVSFLAALPVLALGGTVVIYLFTNAEDLFGLRI